MSCSKFEELCREMMATIKASLIEKGLVPNVLMGTEDGQMIILESLPRKVWPLVAQVLSHTTPVLFHVSEAWWAEIGEDEYKTGGYRLPADREDRKECIIFEARSKDGEGITLRQVFEHDWDGKIKWIGEVAEVEKGKSYVLDGVY